MPVNLIIPGVPVEPERREETLFPGDPEAELKITVRHAARVDVAVRGAAPVEHVFKDADERDVVEVELEGGVREWMSVSQLRDDLMQGALSMPVRSADEIRPIPEGELRIPAALPGGLRTRGTAGWVIKGMQLLGISPVKPLADLAEAAVVQRFEKQHAPGPGLYPCPPDLALDPKSALKPGDLTHPGPYLVFIHGTASSTLGSFGKLAGTAEWRDLLRKYSGRICALQHHTLSVSPIQNAIDLLGLLPGGARVHLVSHSRGGLVGELVCRGEIPAQDLEHFRKLPKREADVKLLEELSRLARDRKIAAERFVRVACPAQGTILASRRLDLYLSVILNLFGLIPVLKASALYDILKATLMEVARRRMDPARLPGLEAQMPRSPVINLLNREKLSVAGELGVIAGDVQAGGGIRRSLVTLATDLFYLTKHDLVVNTDSMYGGAGREKVYLFFDRGSEVNHFSYFANPGSRNRLHAWLTREGAERQGDLFAGPPAKPTRALRGVRSEGPADGPIVFLLPDFLGTALHDEEGHEVWPSIDALALGGLERLADPGKGGPGDLLPVYDALRDHLASRHQVRPFPFDSRKSALEEGRRLAEAVSRALDGAQRVSILAHGQGGLVALGMIAADAAVWKRLRAGGGLLVLVGAPLRGTHFASRLLRGEEDLIRQLDIVDLAREIGGIAGIFAGWPGLLEMLPDEALAEEWWKAAPAVDGGSPAPVPGLADLARARESRSSLAAALEKARGDDGMACVAGWAPWTPVSLNKDTAGNPLWEGTAEGDGRVPYAFGLVGSLPSSYAEMSHGDLARNPGVFLGLAELLDRGRTRLLPDAPPQRARSGPVSVPGDAPQLFPGVEDLQAAALGFDVRGPQVEDEVVLRVSVSHGNLRHSSLPLAVGHYAGDTIVSAEKVLDRELGGALSERYRLGLYPGPKGTFEVVLAPGSTPPGALVIGLGDLGELSAAAVTQGVTRAALRYALKVAERPAKPGEAGTWRSAAFSSLLIGTGGGLRSISVEESVTAVVRGAMEANRVLRSQGFWERVRIDGVELVELYESVAIQAVRAARRLVSYLQIDPSENERLEVVPRIRRVEGGKIRPPVSQYDTGWWKRLQILQYTEGDLTFEVLTEKARTERLRLGLQRALVDPMVAEASANPWYNEATSKTLFELLIPNELKDQAREEADLVLLLDDDTVQYPWELLTEGSLERTDPLGTCVGLIRQLRTEEREFRAVVRPPRDRFALVVGDPPSELIELPGAQAEAREVEALLTSSAFEVVPVIRQPAASVIRELMARDYQILHLAGHGHYDPRYPERSGMVLGNGSYLTSIELGQLRAVPPFVFVNCCHLGRVGEQMQTRFHRLAASLALQLIRIGVRALVVAGWAVHDHVAPVFARTLYQELLAGETFGRAVLRARRRAYETDPASNTWGAYQCYGDPDFVLDLRRARQKRKPEASYAAPRELLEALIDLRADAQRADADRVRELREWLDEVEADLPEDWRDGELLAALGDLRKDLGDWEKAIRVYREAFESWGARASLKTVETLANLETRWADRLRKAPQEGQSPTDLIRGALARIEALIQLGGTPERLSLAGSAYKRFALATTGEERESALRKAVGLYREAHETALRKTGSIDPYPALNWIACRIALGNIRQKREIRDRIEECRKEGERLASSSGQFFHRLHAPDAVLHRHLVDGTLTDPGVEQEVIAIYRQALVGQSGYMERSSVAEHLEFLAEMLREREPATAQALERIQNEIQP